MGGDPKANDILTLSARTRALLQALEGASAELERLAQEARQIFTETGKDRNVRWLDCEVEGYGTVSDIRPLHDVLGVAVGDPLAAAVVAYRTQVGRRWTGPAGHDELVHFFVEPLAVLVAGRNRLRAARVGPFVELLFGAHPDALQYPTSAEFPADVFERILAGFVSTLRNELRGLVT
jgi:hypothetical protein